MHYYTAPVLQLFDQYKKYMTKLSGFKEAVAQQNDFC